MEICLFGTRQTNKQRAKQEKINKSKKKRERKKNDQVSSRETPL